MKRYKLIAAMLGIFWCGYSTATTTQQLARDDKWKSVISLGAGPAWSNQGTSQTIYLLPDVQKNYDVSNGLSSTGSGEIFIGMQYAANPKILLQLGLAAAVSLPTIMKGDIWEDADPDFNNSSYEYKIKHSHIAVKGKVLVDMSAAVKPYISASAGVGFNRAYDFTINPAIFQQVSDPAFRAETETTFTYTLGIGIQKPIDAHWQIAIGYEFEDWGRNSLARAPGQTAGSGLQLDHLYTNGALIDLSYIS